MLADMSTEDRHINKQKDRQTDRQRETYRFIRLNQNKNMLSNRDRKTLIGWHTDRQLMKKTT